MKQRQSPTEKLRGTPEEAAETTNIVTQPAKLNELMEVITLMGTLSEKVTEHHSQYAGPASAQGNDSAGTRTGTSARDTALQKLPATAQMQRKLVTHIQKEIKNLQREADRFLKERRTGWAYEVTKIFARIRRLSALAEEILRASVETVKRFYIHVFIDRQPLLQGFSTAQPA